MSVSSRLRASYPEALECSTGRPDPALLPLPVIRRAWQSAIQTVTARDLQYAGPEAIEPLAHLLVSELAHDSIPARLSDLIIGSSAQQFMVLSLEVATLKNGALPLVAVEEPGYPTVLDTFEQRGAKLVGVAVDEFGAVPESLDSALRSGAKAVLFTPRGHNPTGASWSPQRLAALADVLAAHPEAIAIEDDQFAGVASTRVGSLLSDPRLESRTIYIRSFSKSIAPDLRTAVAVVRPVLHDAMVDAKSFADGWTSRLLQRVLLSILSDDELHPLLDRARQAYADRRRSAADAVNQVLAPAGGGAWCGPDGVNIWVHLSPGVDSKEAVERSAAAGVRVADGEAFFLRPGHSGLVRLNAGSVPSDSAALAGKILGQSALAGNWRRSGPIHV
jgi:GntR family transcriptional regulator/MocR family aminotransferase